MRFEGLAAQWRDERDRCPRTAGANDAADLGDRDLGYSSRHANAGLGRKQQFVILAAMKGQSRGGGTMDWQGGCIDLGGYPGLRAEVGQIGRKAVTQVQRGSRKATAPEP